MFKRAPRTIRGLSLVVAGVSCLLTLVVGVMTFSLVHHEIERQLDRRIELETQALLGTYRRTDFETLVREVDDRARSAARGTIGYLSGRSETDSRMGYLVVDAEGRRRGGDFDGAMPKAGWSEFARYRRPDGSAGVAQAMNLALDGGGRLVVVADRSALMAVDRKMIRLALMQVGLVAAVAVLATFWFGRVVQRRLESIHGAAGDIMAGDLSRRMPLDGSDGEFDQLAKVLNQMLVRIEDLMSNLKQVSGDIAHDLRTPLTRLRARLEDLDTAGTQAIDPDGLEGALREVDELQALLSGLLALSEIEGHSVRDRFAPVDLAAAIADLAEAYEPDFEAAGQRLITDLAPAQVRGDRPLLLQALSNLLDNSLTHAGTGAQVRLAVSTQARRVRIDFGDDGPGVPSQARERIFQRFVRLDPSRSAPGHGLGLATVAAIIEAHGGSIRVVPSERGLVYVIDLPALEDR